MVLVNKIYQSRIVANSRKDNQGQHLYVHVAAQFNVAVGLEKGSGQGIDIYL